MSTLTCCALGADACLSKDCSISRRTKASKVQNVGTAGGSTGAVVARGLRPIADKNLVMILPGAAGALTAAGVPGVRTTTAVFTWERAGETTTAVAVDDAALTRVWDPADGAGAVSLATLTGTSEVVVPLVGELTADDPPRWLDVEIPERELALRVDGGDFVTRADDDPGTGAATVCLVRVVPVLVGLAPREDGADERFDGG